jgi:hypothetical protein
MGADKPEARKTTTKTQTSILPLLTGVAVLFVTFVISSQVNSSGVSEAPKLSPKEEAKLQKRLKEIDEAEQYALVARNDGFYPCTINGFPSYYLKAGEVWKYGVTSKGESGRYTIKFLVKNEVLYLVQFRGNIAECLKMEQLKLFMYPYLPENLARPLELQLPRPPYNPIMR